MIDIKFMPEYFAESLWTKPKDIFEPTDYNKFPLSEQLIGELEKLDDMIMDIIDWNDPAGESPMSFEERIDLYELAKDLCMRVQEELGDGYNVIDCTDWLNPQK